MVARLQEPIGQKNTCIITSIGSCNQYFQLKVNSWANELEFGYTWGMCWQNSLTKQTIFASVSIANFSKLNALLKVIRHQGHLDGVHPWTFSFFCHATMVRNLYTATSICFPQWLTFLILFRSIPTLKSGLITLCSFSLQMP